MKEQYWCHNMSDPFKRKPAKNNERKIYAYVANNTGNILAIDTETNTVSATIPAFYQAHPESLAITADGGYLYATNTFNTLTTISVINTIDNTVNTISRICYNSCGIKCPDMCALVGVAITPDGRYAYVVNAMGWNNVYVIDIPTNTQIKTIPVGTNPTDIAITPDGGYAYVTNTGSNTISVINIETNIVVDTIKISVAPSYIVITPYLPE